MTQRTPKTLRSSSIDWIVMTAALIGIAMVFAASMRSESGLAANVRPYLSERGFF
ncbi:MULTISPECIES: hypothetical protein [unclassified Sulfitobacter]|uniref:hypothetical protein n=1 Tax=unclassified Sulfitobacter TaxID=196795 RepID=UPI000AE95984|nr:MULTISPECIES: hypothetical protein [unclassified Sulfitobacter]